MNLRCLISLIVLPAALCGCLGGFLEPKQDPTVFYIMTSDANAPQRDIPKNTIVNFLPVSIPSYMARAQIVTRTEGGAVEISEFFRWAELPNGGFVRVISDNISSASENLEVYAYPAVSGQANPLVLRVYIRECVGELSKQLEFKGQYSLSESISQRPFAECDFDYEIPCGATHADYVKSIDAALAKLASEISAAIESHIKGQK